MARIRSAGLAGNFAALPGLALAALLISACTDGGQPPTTAGGAGDPTPSPDSAPLGKIAFVSEHDGNDEIYIVNADGSGLTNLTNNAADDASDIFSQFRNFDWSPDGDRIAFTSTRAGNTDVYVMTADGDGQTRLTTGGRASHPRWSPDGKRIAYVSDREGNKEIYLVNADGTGEARLTHTETWEDYPAWSPDGSRIAFEAGGIFIMSASGTNRIPLVETDDTYFEPVWSPDGTRIAFHAYREATSGDLYEQIFVVNADGSRLTPIPQDSREDAYYSSPQWSPDGRRLAFYSNFEGALVVYVMDSDGSGLRRVSDDGFYFVPTWSPDGSRIAFVGAKTLGEDVAINVYVVNADGSGQTVVTDIAGPSHVAWAPEP